MLWVSDFTYVATWAGFVYVAFVIDTYHAKPRPLTDEERTTVEMLGEENDTLIAAPESELGDGTPEAEAANDRLEAIERELEEIEDGRRTIDPAIRAQLGTFVYIGGDGQVLVHNRLRSTFTGGGDDSPDEDALYSDADDAGDDHDPGYDDQQPAEVDGSFAQAA